MAVRDALMNMVTDYCKVVIDDDSLDRDSGGGHYVHGQAQYDAFTHDIDRIVLRSDWNIDTLVHEYTHAKIHSPKFACHDLYRPRIEVEAQLVAYKVCQNLFGNDNVNTIFAFIDLKERIEDYGKEAKRLGFSNLADAILNEKRITNTMIHANKAEEVYHEVINTIKLQGEI